MDHLTSTGSRAEEKVTPAFEYAALVASYEAEEGYPSEAWIGKFCDLPATAISAKDAADFLVNQLPGIAETISCMQVRISDAVDDYSERPLKRIEYITGGWSGAEDLIGAMLKQFWIRHFHTLWSRGGYYVFDVPESFLKASAVSGDRTEAEAEKVVR